MTWSSHKNCRAEIITIRFAGWTSGRIVIFQLDKDIQRSAAVVKKLTNYEHLSLSKTKKQTQVASGLH